MLTCFSLENVMSGLLLLLRDVFDQKYDLKTIILDAETGKPVKEKDGFALDLITDKNHEHDPVLFEINIEGRGVILMDMF